MTNSPAETTGTAPDLDKLPGHWLLARMGKRVLRPGGRELTDAMLAGLAVGADDDVVELAPGLGATTELVLDRRPKTYTGVEREAEAAARVGSILDDVASTTQGIADHRWLCLVGSANTTGVDDGAASIVFGEAFLTMQTGENKQQIVEEAFRVLRPGGRYGLHELCLRPDALGEEEQGEVRGELSRAIHVGARPLTVADWRTLLEQAGFEIRDETTAAMKLLEPRRLLDDEGLARTLKIVFNVVRTPAARARVRAMRAAFRRNADHLGAVVLVATKPAEPAADG